MKKIVNKNGELGKKCKHCVLGLNDALLNKNDLVSLIPFALTENNNFFKTLEPTS